MFSHLTQLAQRCVCGHVIDTYGDHVLGCGHESLRVKCHDALTDTIYNALLVDNRGSLKEQRCHFDDSSRLSRHNSSKLIPVRNIKVGHQPFV